MKTTTTTELNSGEDIISAEIARTLDGLFRERVRRSPQKIAYQDYKPSNKTWCEYTWAQVEGQVARYQTALSQESLVPGDRVAVMSKNCLDWVIFDQAALGLGLIVVPLYTADRAENAAYILRDSGAKLLLLEELSQWHAFSETHDPIDSLLRIVTIMQFEKNANKNNENRVLSLCDWLPEKVKKIQHSDHGPHSLATIMYTSGTSGRPKGVMLSHNNLLTNAYSCLQIVPVRENDLFLSFLPLSHTFERTIGYYLPLMSGATVAYARSIQQLPEDLMVVQPTVLVSVPRIYERIHAAIYTKLAEKSVLSNRLFNLAIKIGYSRFEYQQKRESWQIFHLLWPLLEKLVARAIMGKFGGRLRLAMTGGAPLSAEVSRTFIGLGLPLLQGYGMTESSPVVCTNRIDNNMPAGVGAPIPGVEVKLGENNALLIRGPNVMLGYWNNISATKTTLTSDGWLNSGDMASIDKMGRVTITGRLKEIIVLSNGEKVPPIDMETAILRDPLFEQVMLIGEGRPYLSALVVLNSRNQESLSTEAVLSLGSSLLAKNQKTEKIILERIAHQIRDFPGYAKIRRVALMPEPWTVENDMLTPTLKLKRTRVMDRYQIEVKRLYEGH